ncbi:hypothetical protein CS542_02805 [Pedobacter sp. IW39]|nr:hypothetical protein CS542_02805 [Pedobacter sp. IW39]
MPNAAYKLQTALPVDVLNQRTLMQTGQTDLAQMLYYTSSFSILNMGSTEAYAEQSTLRGLGPDQLLVLINGKRRYNIAALNLNNNTVEKEPQEQI